MGKIVVVRFFFCRVYIIKMIFSFKINEKLPLEKCVSLLRKILTAWSSA